MGAEVILKLWAMVQVKRAAGLGKGASFQPSISHMPGAMLDALVQRSQETRVS